MKIASIVLFVLLIASLAALVLTTNALKSTKAQLANVQAQLDDEVAHSSALQHDASRNPTGFSPWEECEQPNNFTKTLDFP